MQKKIAPIENENVQRPNSVCEQSQIMGNAFIMFLIFIDLFETSVLILVIMVTIFLANVINLKKV